MCYGGPYSITVKYVMINKNIFFISSKVILPRNYKHRPFKLCGLFLELAYVLFMAATWGSAELNSTTAQSNLQVRSLQSKLEVNPDCGLVKRKHVGTRTCIATCTHTQTHTHTQASQYGCSTRNPFTFTHTQQDFPEERNRDKSNTYRPQGDWGLLWQPQKHNVKVESVKATSWS